MSDCAGKTTTEGHHYKASRMALWLDLIPKLHRADGHDDGFDPLGAADEDRESPLADDLLVVDPRSSTDDIKAVPTGATSTLATYSARKLFLRSPAPTSVRSSVTVDSKPNHADSQPVKSMIAPRAALVATLAIGCLALIVNCVIFVVVYRRRVNLKRLPTTDNHYPPSPSVNVVDASTKSSSVDGRCADGVLPRSRHQQSALYIATALADDVDDADAAGGQDAQPLTPAGRHQSSRHRSPPPPPPPPPPTSRPSTYSPRCSADGCVLRHSTEHANHVATSKCPPRTTASDVWVQLTMQ